jgi:hypothetical protein
MFWWINFMEKSHGETMKYGGWLRNPAPPKGWLKPYQKLAKPPINWCRISQPSTVSLLIMGISWNMVRNCIFSTR